MTHVLHLLDLALIAAGAGTFAAIQSMAPSLGVEVSPINMRDPNEIERAVAAFANNPNSGLIATRSGLALRHRELIVMLAARHKGDRMKPQHPAGPPMTLGNMRPVFVG